MSALDSHLQALENESIFIMREAFAKTKPLAMAWSIGKDSNVMVWLAKKAFFGNVPFPAIHLDTGLEFPEVYEFRDRYAKEWGLDMIAHPCPPIELVDPTLPPATRLASRKTLGLTEIVTKYQLKGFIAGIRRDEQRLRAKERVFSPRATSGEWDFRSQPPEFFQQYATEAPPGTHVRVHAILHWTELDIWRYIKAENIPIVPLYLARDGKRFRSLGEIGITFPIDSNASTIDEIIAELIATKVEERAGRAMDHEAEDSFETLRTSGYL